MDTGTLESTHKHTSTIRSGTIERGDHSAVSQMPLPP